MTRGRGWGRRLWAAGWPYLAIAVIAAITAGGLMLRPVTAGAPLTATRVVVAGAVGLNWDDVDPRQTPHLWRLAESGAIGSMSVRSAHQPTCAADGWLTLGAGNLAAGTLADHADCQQLAVAVEPVGRGAVLPDHEVLVRHNHWEQPWGAVPGALAGSVGCTVAVGQGAALAGARSYGRVDRYAAQLPRDPEAAAELLADSCELAMVDLGAVSGTGPGRAATARRVDRALADLLAARPPDSLLLVVGVADLGGDQQLHVAVADAPGLAPGWLASATTGRTGYLQLVDVAPTVLAAIGRPTPSGLFTGHPVVSHPDRPTDLSDAVAELVAVNHEAALVRPMSAWFLGALTAAQLAVFLAVVPLLRQPVPGRGRRGGPPRWWRTAAPVLLVAAGLAIPAGLAVGGLPWWRFLAPGWAFAVGSLAVLTVASVVLSRTPLFRRTLGLVGAGAGVAAAAVAADLLTGSWLQLNGVVGYSASDGGRYIGISDIGLGVLIVGTLLVAGCLAEQVSRPRRPLAVAVVGAVGVVVAGSPYLGDDIGGAVALLAGVCVAAALCTGGWLRRRRIAWASLVGLAVVVTVAVVDLRRPVEARTGLAGMFTQLVEGTSGYGLQRVSQANVSSFLDTPLTVLAFGAAGFVWFALLRPWGGLKRLFGIHPALRAATVGGTVAALLAGVLVGAALTVVGAAAAVGLPLLTLAAMRLRERSAQRIRLQPRLSIPASDVDSHPPAL